MEAPEYANKFPAEEAALLPRHLLQVLLKWKNFLNSTVLEMERFQISPQQ